MRARAPRQVQVPKVAENVFGGPSGSRWVVAVEIRMREGTFRSAGGIMP